MKRSTFYIITLFPEAFDSYIHSSIIGRAIRDKRIAVKFYNPRDFAKKIGKNGYIRADSRPYGGGPGMVMEAEPVLKAVQKALRPVRQAHGKQAQGKPVIYFFDVSGKQFTNRDAREVAKKSGNIVLIAGHYEGVDARVQKILKAKKVSVGPYTLTGGELPAMLVIDAVARQVKGVLGTFESVEEERVSSSEVYTRPEVLQWKGKKYAVPKVLLSGNHKKIEEWKKSKNSEF
ncbi:tRNA (guanosine(37)-N1)-methyltransferase TrmD [Candidatus Kaiserbacteria bacterium]|nr:tRNA (guanosine(37)-N1)-methyltransferase TrmD [Candidatus Kaiserbacteria bacterium]